jgi:hypothetical protein
MRAVGFLAVALLMMGALTAWPGSAIVIIVLVFSLAVWAVAFERGTRMPSIVEMWRNRLALATMREHNARLALKNAILRGDAEEADSATGELNVAEIEENAMEYALAPAAIKLPDE